MKGIREYKILVFVIGLFFIVSCDTSKTKKNKDSFKTKNIVNANKSTLNINNFKDNVKTFSVFDETYNSFKKTILIKDIFYTATILPKDYFIINNLKQKDSLNFYKEKLKREEVFQFDFQHINDKDLLKTKATNYEEYVKYLSSSIKKDFYALTSKGDTIKPKGVFFERSFTLTPYKRVLVYFNFPNEIEREIKLVYRDELFQNGILKFLLKK
jgi:hypothetical protein